MKTTPSVIVTLTRPDGGFWTRVRIGMRHWQLLERRARILGTTVLGLILAQSEGRSA